MLPISLAQPKADDLPATDDFDRDPDAEQSALCRHLRLWPAALSARCRRQEAAAQTRLWRLARLHPRRPSRLHRLDSTPAESQDPRDQWPELRGRASVTAARGGGLAAGARRVRSLRPASQSPLCGAAWTPGGMGRLRPRPQHWRRAELSVDCGRAHRRGNRGVDHRRDDARRGRSGPGDSTRDRSPPRRRRSAPPSGGRACPD